MEEGSNLFVSAAETHSLAIRARAVRPLRSAGTGRGGNPITMAAWAQRRSPGPVRLQRLDGGTVWESSHAALLRLWSGGGQALRRVRHYSPGPGAVARQLDTASTLFSPHWPCAQPKHVLRFCNTVTQEYPRIPDWSITGPLPQGYGLTESCAASFIAQPDNYAHLGTVGPPMPATELRLEVCSSFCGQGHVC